MLKNYKLDSHLLKVIEDAVEETGGGIKENINSVTLFLTLKAIRRNIIYITSDINSKIIKENLDLNRKFRNSENINSEKLINFIINDFAKFTNDYKKEPLFIIENYFNHLQIYDIKDVWFTLFEEPEDILYFL